MTLKRWIKIKKHPILPLMTLRLFISVLFVASLGSACVHSRFSADGAWIGKARTTIEAEGQKLIKSSFYRFDLKPDGTCSISVESFWEVDGTKTVDEFEGSWEQRSNALTVKYNLLDRKNADAKYATTPRGWNEVRHVFQIYATEKRLKGTIDEAQLDLTRN